jgi:hypothetical protein
MRHCKPITLLMCMVLSGCGSRQSPPLKGVVLTNPETSKSLLLSARRYATDGDARVSGATIRIFLDAQLTDEINERSLVSDDKGEYQIPTNGLPASKDSHGFYYLLVEKEGFSTLTYPVTVGRLSPYLEHTVYLGKRH